MLTNRKGNSSDNVLAAYWNQEAAAYAPRYQGKFNEAHAFRIRLQRVCEMLGQPEGRILDVGCGPGIMVDYLLENGCEAFGVDISEEMIIQGQQRLSSNVSAHLSVGKIESLEFPDGFFLTP